MARVFITGSTDGLGRAAALSLIAKGHEVVLHARSAERAAAVADIAEDALGVAIGDLQSTAETKSIAEQINAIGRMDAVIHNAGIYRDRDRGPSPEGHARILAINALGRSAARHRLDRSELGPGAGICGKQALRCRFCFRPGAALAGSPDQCRRSWVGAHKDGRCARSGNAWLPDSGPRPGSRSRTTMPQWSAAVTGRTSISSSLPVKRRIFASRISSSLNSGISPMSP